MRMLRSAMKLASRRNHVIYSAPVSNSTKSLAYCAVRQVVEIHESEKGHRTEIQAYWVSGFG